MGNLRFKNDGNLLIMWRTNRVKKEIFCIKSEQLWNVSQTLACKRSQATLEWENYMKLNFVVCVLVCSC